MKTYLQMMDNMERRPEPSKRRPGRRDRRDVYLVIVMMMMMMMMTMMMMIIIMIDKIDDNDHYDDDNHYNHCGVDHVDIMMNSILNSVVMLRRQCLQFQLDAKQKETEDG